MSSPNQKVMNEYVMEDMIHMSKFEELGIFEKLNKVQNN